MFFRITIEGELDLIGHIVMTECLESGGYFPGCNNTWKLPIATDIIILKYFSFTTLSTVGFGDFNPRSNTERLLIALGMLGGVAIFSLILSMFIDMLDKVKAF